MDDWAIWLIIILFLAVCVSIIIWFAIVSAHRQKELAFCAENCLKSST